MRWTPKLDSLTRQDHPILGAFSRGREKRFKTATFQVVACVLVHRKIEFIL